VADSPNMVPDHEGMRYSGLAVARRLGSCRRT
jgi:hypothetical protein